MDKSVLASLAAFILATTISAQSQSRPRSSFPPPQTTSSTTLDPPRFGLTVIVTVVDEAGMPLDKEATVKLFDQSTQSVNWGMTKSRSEVQFNHVEEGDYEVEASAPGFKSAHEQFTAVASSHEVYRVTITLPRDISGAATEIRPGQILAPKARKEAEKGVAALQEGNFAEAQKHLGEAYKLAPTNSDVNYLLGLLFEQRKDLAQAESYLRHAISLDPRHVGAQTELGEVLLQQKTFDAAAAALESAVNLDPKQYRARWLLADAYLKEKQFDKAQREARLAIQNNAGDSAAAQLVLGESLTALGRNEEAIQVLEGFLRHEPNSAAASDVRSLLARLQASPKPAAKDH